MPHALRIRGRVVVTPACERVGWTERRTTDARLSTAGREALAAAWLRLARDHHASIAAYAKLSMNLLALGAPRELIEACHRAALDEIEHARRGFSLASAYAGRAFGPGTFDALLRPERDARDLFALLERVVRETIEDGCLGEAYAAELAREGLLHVQDPDAAELLTSLAHAEAAHAELAWRIVYWCCHEPTVRGAVREACAELPRVIMPPRIDPRIAGELARHGQVTADRKRALFVEVRQDLVARVARILDDSRTVQLALVGA
jgi:hypothetical protein